MARRRRADGSPAAACLAARGRAPPQQRHSGLRGASPAAVARASPLAPAPAASRSSPPGRTPRRGSRARGPGVAAGAGGRQLAPRPGGRAPSRWGRRAAPRRAAKLGAGGAEQRALFARARARGPRRTASAAAAAAAGRPHQQQLRCPPPSGSPTKNFSPLLQQILAADDLGSDESVLQKMRDIIKQYSDVVPPAADPAPLDPPAALPDAGLDFTSAWVHGNGVIRPAAAAAAAVASPAGPPSSAGRKSSVASTATSASTAPAPRRDSKPEGGATRIPLPVFYSASADC
ncbi:GAS2-like protein 1 [Gryllus bimaculatus]|nr:GAS2-like protein 1 [Gryllus bimaculatus]